MHVALVIICLNTLINVSSQISLLYSVLQLLPRTQTSLF